MKNKFDAILPCRMTSTRLYGKPLQYIDIKNKITIIENLVSYLKTSKYLNKIILAIAETKGNDILAEHAIKNNWEFSNDRLDALYEYSPHRRNLPLSLKPGTYIFKDIPEHTPTGMTNIGDDIE